MPSQTQLDDLLTSMVCLNSYEPQKLQDCLKCFKPNQRYEHLRRTRNNDNITALHYASFIGDVETIKCMLHMLTTTQIIHLLKIQTSGYGYTPIHVAVKQGHVETTSCLLEALPEDKRYELLIIEDCSLGTALHIAVWSNNLQSVTKFSELLTPKDLYDLLIVQTWSGHTAMHLAAKRKNLEVVQNLFEILTVEQRYDVLKVRNKTGCTALTVAAYLADEETVAWLLQGLSSEQLYTLLSIPNVNRYSALHYAAYWGLTEVIRIEFLYRLTPQQQIYLLNMETNFGHTAQYIAEQKDMTETAEYLIQLKLNALKAIQHSSAVTGEEALVAGQDFSENGGGGVSKDEKTTWNMESQGLTCENTSNGNRAAGGVLVSNRNEWIGDRNSEYGEQLEGVPREWGRESKNSKREPSEMRVNVEEPEKWTNDTRSSTTQQSVPSSGAQTELPLVTTNIGSVGLDQSGDLSQLERMSVQERYKTFAEQRTKYKRKNVAKVTYPPAQSDLKYEISRRETFSRSALISLTTAKRLSADGLFLNNNKIFCTFCTHSYEVYEAVDSVDDVLTRHHKNSSSANRACLDREGNIPHVLKKQCYGGIVKSKDTPTSETSQLAQLGVVVELSKHPEFAVDARRTATFLTYPYHSATSSRTEELAEAGYFYSGEGDSVTCFSCGVTSSKWEPEEGVWQRHAKSSARCQFVLSQKGADFIHQTIETFGEYHAPRTENRINSVTTRTLRPRWDSNAVQGALSLGIEREKVKTVVNNRIMKGDRDFVLVADIVREVTELPKPDQDLTPSYMPRLPDARFLIDNAQAIRNRKRENDDFISDFEDEEEEEPKAEEKPPDERIEQHGEVEDMSMSMSVGSYYESLSYILCSKIILYDSYNHIAGADPEGCM